MVLPGLLRDGICGLVSCADVVPEVGVGRPTGSELAVVVPEEVAGEMLSLRLFPRGGASLPEDVMDMTDEEQEAAAAEARRQEENGVWLVYRVAESDPTTIPLGEEPPGFATRTPLEVEPVRGAWVLEASFGCSSSSVRFSPTDLDPGFVTSGGDPTPVGQFNDEALTNLRCSTDAPGWQQWLFGLGALLASAGAVLGIVTVFRRPPHDPDWYGAEEA